MRVEEKCACGAAITLLADEARYRSERADAAQRERELWKQIDRWRKLHVGCRQGMQPIHSAPISNAPVRGNAQGPP